MTSVDPQTWWQFGLALALGLLVGLERERTGHTTGIRTFPLITLLGASAALLTPEVGGWLVAAGLMVVAAGIIAHHWHADELGSEGDHGTTTLVAAFVMYLVGAMLVVGYASVAVVLAGMTAVLLHWKEPMHRFVEEIDPEAKTAVYRFVLIAVVVLPILPNRTYGPYDVFNPYHIWLIVSLIVGISVAGYIAYQFLGARVGVLLGGVLGGIVSSTAATVAYARRSSRAPAFAPSAAVAIMIAATLAFGRIVVEVLVVAPEVRWVVLPKFAVLIGLMAAVSVGAYFSADGLDEQDEASQPEDPAALKAAIIFGALYAVILFAVAAAKEHFGDQGMYVVATLSGLTDVDAITLSTAQMMTKGRIDPTTGWRMMLIGGLSNVIFKGGAVAVLGSRKLLGRIAVLFGITIVGGLGILVLWPV